MSPTGEPYEGRRPEEVLIKTVRERIRALGWERQRADNLERLLKAVTAAGLTQDQVDNLMSEMLLMSEPTSPKEEP